jgi:hypothetical protein
MALPAGGVWKIKKACQCVGTDMPRISHGVPVSLITGKFRGKCYTEALTLQMVL